MTDLDEQGFGDSASGLPFTRLHGYLITEIFNDQAKLHAGPNAAGFTTDIDTKRITESEQLTPMQRYDAYWNQGN